MRVSPAPRPTEAADSSAAIATRDLTKTFGGITAVDSLDLQVPSRRIHALLGPNGSGKTTTVRMLAGPSSRVQ